MLDKKITRKEFLVSVLSIAALFAINGKVSNTVKKLTQPKQKVANGYGNHAYGGGKKNA